MFEYGKGLEIRISAAEALIVVPARCHTPGIAWW